MIIIIILVSCEYFDLNQRIPTVSGRSCLNEWHLTQKNLTSYFRKTFNESNITLTLYKIKIKHFISKITPTKLQDVKWMIQLTKWFY